MSLQPKSVLSRARSCIRIEQEALAETARKLGDEFVATARAVDTVSAAGGKLIFCGVGTNYCVGTSVRDGDAAEAAHDNRLNRARTRPYRNKKPPFLDR